MTDRQALKSTRLPAMNATGMRSAAAVHLADARASMVSPMASAMPAPEMAPAKVSATQVMMVDRPQADPNANRSVIGPTVIAARVIGTIPTAIGRVGDGHHARRRNVRRAGGGGLESMGSATTAPGVLQGTR
jgi:hypothetical protein